MPVGSPCFDPIGARYSVLRTARRLANVTAATFTVAAVAQMLLAFYRASLIDVSAVPGVMGGLLLAFLAGVSWARNRGRQSAALVRATTVVLTLVGVFGTIAAVGGSHIAILARVCLISLYGQWLPL
jgi:hypothetical protein